MVIRQSCMISAFKPNQSKHTTHQRKKHTKQRERS
uniref:Uncharacterized protein n=1 Tax=Rhizophora mucronata TaxID=61149 RepID=A0A2P2QLT8_RHIMU